MKKFCFLLLPLCLISCIDRLERPLPDTAQVKDPCAETKISPDKEEVSRVLDQWHEAAGKADFEEYFGLMAENSIYIGTDATENWDLEEFKDFSKPYFDRGRAWDFTPIARNIYFSEAGSTAWFDELLDTHMGICRGSGILSFQDGEWKIAHYVLSMTVPNEQADKVTELKQEIDSSVLGKPGLRGALKDDENL